MPTIYKIDSKQRLVFTTAWGTFTLNDALSHQDKLSRDPDFDPSFSQIIDLTQVKKVEVTGEDVREIAARSIFAVNARRAVIVSTDAGYGLVRMFETYRELQGEKGIRVFRELDGAVHWALTGDAESA